MRLGEGRTNEGIESPREAPSQIARIAMKVMVGKMMDRARGEVSACFQFMLIL
jgi:hypothetical protein